MKLEVPPQKIVLARSDEQLEYGISSHDWDHLKHLVDSISIAEPIHLTLATFFCGISITALFSAISLPDDVILVGYPGKLVYWSICLVFFFSGISCGIYAYKQRDEIHTSKDGVKTYLNHLEEKFGNDDQNMESD